MRIAINTRFLIPDKMEGIGWYSYEVVKRMIEAHPEDEFILFFDRPDNDHFKFPRNTQKVILRPPARHPILFRIWFNLSVKRALKKYKPDVFYSPDGFLSLTTNVPQVPVIHDINFEHHPEDLPNHFLKYYKTYFPKFVQKAAHIITVSEYSKQDICKTYNVEPNKITVAWNGASENYLPVSEEAKLLIRDKYAQGKPYYLFVGALHPRKNLKRLIQAYAQIMEEDSQHPYELVIVGEELWKNASTGLNIPEKTKDHIHFTGRLNLDELTLVMGSAAIFTFVPYFEGFGIPLVEAMRSGVPIVAGELTSLPEVAGDAALYCDPFDIGDIAAKMVRLANDAALQKELIDKGLERSKIFSWNKTAETVYEVLRKISQ